MSHNMGAVQEIGITIDLSTGSNVNTVFTNGKLQLVEVGTDSDGNIIYANSGYWESDNILIQDKIASFKNIVKTITTTGNATLKIYTKSSEDGFTWSTYVEINQDGSINSPVGKYAKVKIEIIPELVNANFVVDDFNDANKYDSEYLNYDSGILEIKRDYNYTMNKDISWVDEGTLFIKTIEKTKLKKIDLISLI